MRLNLYKEFTDDINFLEFLNEGTLQASSDFIDRLNSIKDNKIAKKLISTFDNAHWVPYEMAQNYIDVTPEEDLISFISDKRVDKDEPEDPFVAKGRGTVKIGRFIHGIKNNKELGHVFQGITITDKDIEEFVNLYKSSKIENKNRFEIVEGDDIARWYKSKRYKEGNGQLNSSCMADADKDFFKIYTKNPRVCKMLIYLNEDGLMMGRALLWKLDESPNNIKWFLDRIYTVRDSDVNRFREYAKKEGWLYKYRNGYDDVEGVLFRHNGNPVIGKITIKLRECDFDEYPFIDTVAFLNKKNRTLSNVGSKGCIILRDTDGESSECYDCNGDGKIEEWDDDLEKDVKKPCPECVGILQRTISEIEGGEYEEYKDLISNLKK